MCGKIYRDKEGKNQAKESISCRVINFGEKINNTPVEMDMFVEESLGDKLTAQIDPKFMNARIESIPRIWIPKGMKYVQTEDRILSFQEGDKLFSLPEKVDILCLAAIINNEWSFKIVTRDDGLTYYKKYNKFPPLVTEKVAKREYEVHPRWPIYRQRIIA